MSAPVGKDEQKQTARAIPEVAAIDQAAAQMEEILDQAILDVLNKTTPDQLIGVDPAKDLPKGTAYPASTWIHGPGHVELLAMADERLTRVANMKLAEGEAQVNRVEKVIAKLVPGTKILTLRPAPAEDMTAVPVTRYEGQSGAWINLFALLKSANLTVDSGYREMYLVHYMPKSSPLWPALMIDLGARKDRRLEPSRKKKQQAEPGESA